MFRIVSKKRLVAALTSVGVVLCLSLVAQASAPAREVPSNGLDTLLLIDVSGSMTDSGSPQQPPGDKEGVRWDGTNLILDLAAEEDRIGLITFGIEIKPLQRDPGGVLTLMTPGNREDFRLQVEGLYNKDRGGTRILEVLDRAVDCLKQDGESGRGLRRGLVILLTDGHETRHPDEAAREESLYSHLRHFRKNGIPVHTIGLGKEVDDQMLERIALYTGGGYRRISSNAMLFQVMREIHWAAKRLWIRQEDLQPDGQGLISATGSAVDGIVDLGILMYRKTGVLPKLAVAPEVRPAIRWIGADGNAVASNIQPEVREHESYGFYYFGPSDGKSPLRELAAGDRPVVSLKPKSKHVHHIAFAVRTASALFDLVSPGGDAKFRYGEPIPIRVRFFQHRLHKPSDFELDGVLIGAGGHSSRKPVRLLWNAKEKTFEHDWVLKPDSPEFPEGYYEALVTIRGTSGPFAGYRRTLPQRTIFLGGKFNLLIPPQDVVLSGGNSYRTQISIGADTTAPFPIDCVVEPPTLDGKPVCKAELFTLTPAKPVVDKGSLALELSFRDKESAGVPVEKTLESGYVVVGGDYISEPKRIPFDLSRELYSVGLKDLDDGRIPALTANQSGTRVSSAALELISLDANRPLPKDLKVSVTLVPPEGLERDEVGLYVDDAANSASSQEVTPGRAFHISFASRPDRQAGKFTGRLRIEGKSVRTREYVVPCNLNSPTLKISGVPKDSTIRETGPLGVEEIDLMAEIEGGGIKQSIHIRPKEETNRRVLFRSKDGELLPLTYTSSTKDKPLEIGPGESGKLRVTITVPKDVKCGVYTADFVAEGANVEPVTVPVTLTINDLRLDEWVWKDDMRTAVERAEPAQLAALAIPGDEAGLSVRIAGKLAVDIDLDKDVEVRLGRVVNDRGDVLAPPKIETDSNTNSLTMTFSIPDQVFADAEYQMDLSIRHKRQPLWSVDARVRLVIERDPIDLKPHNPVEFLLPSKAGGQSQEVRHTVVANSPQYVRYQFKPAPLKCVGREGTEVIPVERFEIRDLTRKPIMEGEDGEVIFTLTPGKIRPGRYVGKFTQETFRLEPSRQLPDRYVEVEVIAAGREIGSLTIHTPDDDRPYVGHPMVARFFVDCVQCELGLGRITITESSAKEEATQPSKTVIQVTERHRGESKTLKDSVSTRVEFEVPISTLKVGKHIVEVDWPPAFPASGGQDWTPTERLTTQTSLDVRPAICVSQRFPFLHERLRIEAVAQSDEELPDSIKIDVVHQDLKGDRWLDKLTLGDDGSDRFGDRVSTDGTFSTILMIDQRGRYTFSLPEEHSLAPMAPAVAETLFELGGGLGASPKNPFSVDGLESRGTCAVMIPTDADLTKDFSVSFEEAWLLRSGLKPIVHWTAEVQYCEESDPELRPKVTLSQTEGDLSGGAAVGFDLSVELPAVTDRKSDVHPAWQPFIYDLTYDLHLSWTDENGNRLQRSLTVPFSVKVKEEQSASPNGTFPWTILIAVSVLLAACLLIWRFRDSLSGSFRRAKQGQEKRRKKKEKKDKDNFEDEGLL